MSKNIINTGGHSSYSPEFKLAYTEAEKKRDNYAIVRSLVSTMSNMKMSKDSREAKYNNLSLSHGRFPMLEEQGFTRELQLTEENGGNITLGRRKVNHYGGVQNLVQAQAADLLNSSLDWTIKDYGEYSTQADKQAQRDKNVGFLKQTYLAPIFKKAMIIENQALGIKNDFDVNDEELIKQRDTQVQSRMEEMIHPDVRKALSSNKTPTKELLRRLTEISVELGGFEYELFKASTSAVANAEMFFRRTFDSSGIKMTFMDELNSVYRLSNESDYMEDGLMFKNRRYLSPMELVATGADILKNKNWKEIESMLEPMPDSVHRHAMIDLDYAVSDMDNPEFIIQIPYPKIDTDRNVQYQDQNYEKTREFLHVQDTMKMADYQFRNNKKGFPVDFMTWRDSTKGRLVRRKTKSGKIIKVPRGYHYKLNKTEGDIDSEMIPLPRTYEAEGWGDMIVGYGPTPYQNLIPGDWKHPKLSVYGAVFNSDTGRVKNSSNVDYAKIHVLRRNILHDTYNDNIQKDLGSVLALDRSIIKDYKGGMQEFLTLLYEEGIIFHNKADRGRRFDYSDIKVHDLSRMKNAQDIQNAIEFYDRKIQEELKTDAARSGSMGQYANRRNLELGVENYNRQNHRQFFFWRTVKQNLLTAIMQGSLYHYKGDDEFLKRYLNDEEFAHMTNNWDEITGTHAAIKIEDDSESVRLAKEYLANASAAGGDSSAYIKTLGVNSLDAAERVADDLSLQAEKRMLDQRASDERMQKVAADSQERSEQRRIEAAANTEATKSEDKRFDSVMKSLINQNAADVNKDNIADSTANAQENNRTQIAITEMKIKGDLEKEIIKSRIKK